MKILESFVFREFLFDHHFARLCCGRRKRCKRSEVNALSICLCMLLFVLVSPAANGKQKSSNIIQLPHLYCIAYNISHKSVFLFKEACSDYNRFVLFLTCGNCTCQTSGHIPDLVYHIRAVYACRPRVVSCS